MPSTNRPTATPFFLPFRHVIERFGAGNPVPRPRTTDSGLLDRVVHHLLVPRLEALFEPVFIFDSYSNRKGKGTHGAVERLQTFMRQVTKNGKRPAHFLQLDIRNFFNSIDRKRLFGMLSERLEKIQKSGTQTNVGGALAPKDVACDATLSDVGTFSGASPLLRGSRNCVGGGLPPKAPPITANDVPFLRWLCRVILTGNSGETAVQRGAPALFERIPPHKRLKNAPPGKGLPIGNLTSQFFANVYLDRLDQFVKHTLKCRHYLRYVDDFILLHESAEQLAA